MANLEAFLEQRRAAGKTLTLVTGVFDVLHEEHRLFLEKAKQTADLLLVGIESDVRVRVMKGEGRPVHSAPERVSNLMQLGLADFVFVLPEQFSKPEDHRRLIEHIRPNSMAVSAHTLHQREKAMILAEFDAKLVVVHEHNPHISSTHSINQKKGHL